MVETNLAKAASSSALTSVKAATAEVFWLTKVPNLALPLIMAYGTPIFLHKAGRKTTNSIGSTSLAIKTNLAFLFSIKETTWFKPYLTAYGFGEASCLDLPSAIAAASLVNLSFFSAAVSGLYLLNNLKVSAAVFLSKVYWN
ncbi:unnamed protein product [Saccharomyces cerevisiae]|nr:unnamed protein product [Saccharomyces cerevisiae]